MGCLARMGGRGRIEGKDRERNNVIGIRDFSFLGIGLSKEEGGREGTKEGKNRV